MAIVPQGSAATTGNRTTGFTLVINAGVETNDLLVLAVTNRGATADPTVTDNDTGGNTWQKKVGQNANTNGAVTVWWKRATAATAGKTITVANCTNSSSGGVTPFRGASQASDPWLGCTPVSEANASGDETQAQIDVGFNNGMVILVVGCTNDDQNGVTSQNCTSPGALAQQFNGTSTGGSDCSCTMACAVKVTAGVTGAFTWAQTNGTGASIALALRPLDSVTGTGTLVAQDADVSGTATGTTTGTGVLEADEAILVGDAYNASIAAGTLLAQPASVAGQGVAGVLLDDVSLRWDVTTVYEGTGDLVAQSASLAGVGAWEYAAQVQDVVIRWAAYTSPSGTGVLASAAAAIVGAGSLGASYVADAITLDWTWSGSGETFWRIKWYIVGEAPYGHSVDYMNPAIRSVNLSDFLTLTQNYKAVIVACNADGEGTPSNEVWFGFVGTDVDTGTGTLAAQSAGLIATGNVLSINTGALMAQTAVLAATGVTETTGTGVLEAQSASMSGGNLADRLLTSDSRWVSRFRHKERRAG